MRHCGILFDFTVAFDDEFKEIRVYPVYPMNGSNEPYRVVTTDTLITASLIQRFFKEWCTELCTNLEERHGRDWVNAFKVLENARNAKADGSSNILTV